MNPSEKNALASLLEARGDILFAYLFGSQASGTTGPLSDVDVAVFTRSPISFDARLLMLADLTMFLKTDAVDLIELRDAPPLLTYEVVSSGQLLFSKDSGAQNRFEQKSFLRYFDTQHLRDVQNQYLRHHLGVP
jgi:predicted nucleotidyltransferase